MGIVIIGAGGFGREVLDVIDAATEECSFLGFLDDGSPDLDRVAALGERLLGGLDELARIDATYVIGVGSPATRRMLDERAAGHGRDAASPLVHRTAAVGRRTSFGPGTVVCAQAAITTNIVAGRHLHVNLTATIGHDCTIGDHVTLAPGVNVSGNVTLGHGVELGTGAKVLPGVSIGDGAIVGAGAVVTKDVAPGTTVVGIPAKPR